MELYWSIVFAFIGVSAGLTVQTLDEDVGEVVLVNMIYRHGERSVLEEIEGDPLTELKYWPKGYGQLTNIGIQHQYNLGKWLGQRYKNLIPGGLYNSSLFYFMVDEMDRTMMSGEANLAGMFPPVGEDVWSKTLNWQPIPLHVIPKDEDNLIGMTAPCPRATTLMYDLIYSKEALGIMEKYGSLWLETKSQYPGFSNMTTVDAMYLAASDISCEMAANLTISDWAKEHFQELNQLSGEIIGMMNDTPELKQLIGGPLLNEILNSMQAKAGGSPINIIGYSAHDNTVANVFNVMGMYNYLPPPFAAAALFELRKTKDNQFVVTTLYQNNTNPEDEPFLLTPNGCDAACPLDKFVAMYQNVIPNDYALLCIENDSSSSSSENSTEDYSGDSNSQEIVAMTQIEGPGFAITEVKDIELYGPGVDYIDIEV